MAIKVLALDLERTLIDDALSALARPGLLAFLEFCRERFGRVAVFSTVEEADAREVLEGLGRRGLVPPDLMDRLEYVDWSGEYNDLGFVPGVAASEVLLIDDDAGWIRPDQRGSWIPIAPWDGGPDEELPRVRSLLESRLAGRSSG
ncbi:NIF family HAD-type phosphatase [Singulisphaera sp. PoT]|uniref:NIF family HAD-type phosphatase n=1 Tax=Singulisphaera sp. PoT TaxID=3411797 RepID=UPI003BF5496A